MEDLFFAVIVLLFLGLSPLSAEARPGHPALPEGVRFDADLIYARVGGRDLALDLCWHTDPARLTPLVVWVHGGAWRGGSKDNLRNALPLVNHGYAVASVEYRLSQEAQFPAQIQDCKAAVRWLRANAAEYHLEPDRIAVWGSSAGGHLVALLGTASDLPEWETVGDHSDVSSRVQAVCDWFGPTDFLRMNDTPGKMDHDAPDSPESQLIGGPIQENVERVRLANPITYASPDDPPFLIVHGEDDRTVLPNQSELLHQALQEKGVDVTLTLIPGQGHGFRGPAHAEAVQQAIAFFDRHLK